MAAGRRRGGFDAAKRQVDNVLSQCRTKSLQLAARNVSASSLHGYVRDGALHAMRPMRASEFDSSHLRRGVVEESSRLGQWGPCRRKNPRHRLAGHVVNDGGSMHYAYCQAFEGFSFIVILGIIFFSPPRSVLW